MNLQSNLKEYLNKSSSSSSSKSKPYLAWFSSSSNDNEELIKDEDVATSDDTEDRWFSNVKEDPCLPSLVIIWMVMIHIGVMIREILDI